MEPDPVDIDLDSPRTGWDEFETSLPGSVKLVHRDTQRVRIVPRDPPRPDSQWHVL